MRGKEKCKALKESRQKIAEQNDIAFAVSECTHQGDCRGTCPKCEAELRYLERQLEIRKNLGKAVVVAGISAGMCAPMVACSPSDVVNDIINAIDILDTSNDVDIAGMEGPAPEDEYDEPDGEDILGGLEEYDPDDLDAILPSENDSEVLAGEVPLAPSSEGDSEEESIEIEEYILEGDVAIDPEFIDEE